MRLPFTLSKERQFDAVGFGLNAVDHLIVVPQYPEFDTKIPGIGWGMRRSMKKVLTDLSSQLARAAEATPAA